MANGWCHEILSRRKTTRLFSSLSKGSCKFIQSTSIADKNKSISTTIRDADIFSSTLLKFTDHKIDGRKREKSIQSHFPYVKSAFPTKMILPLQDALTCSLPTSSDTVKTHNPFPNAPIEIHGKSAQPLAVLILRCRGPRGHYAFTPETKETCLHRQRWQGVPFSLQAARRSEKGCPRHGSKFHDQQTLKKCLRVEKTSTL